jgi:DNA polymerase-3 subunit chi
MPEVLFYHLERRTLEDVLPSLLEKTRARGWKANVRVGSAERMEVLDNHLWTFSDQSFLAHGTSADGHSSRQPVYLTTEEDDPNDAQVLFLVDGAAAGNWAGANSAKFERIVLLFDGGNPNALNEARTAWKSAKEAGHQVTYWKESSGGRWEKQE